MVLLRFVIYFHSLNHNFSRHIFFFILCLAINRLEKFLRKEAEQEAKETKKQEAIELKGKRSLSLFALP